MDARPVVWCECEGGTCAACAAERAAREARAAELARLEARWGREALQRADARMVRACDAGIVAAAEEAAAEKEEYGE